MLKEAAKSRTQRRAEEVRPDRAEHVQPAEAPRGRFPTQALGLGLAGAVLLWAAFPPLDLPYLAWIAPLPWLWLVRQPARRASVPLASEHSASVPVDANKRDACSTETPAMQYRGAYLALWLAGTIHWLVMMHGIRLAHPALNAGWIALAAYLGIYLPLFVGLTRVAVHRLNLSLVVAAPAVWVGLELVRGHMITGFSMGLLAHTQAEFPLLIQVADLAGGYTLSFAIMLVAACLARMLPVGGGWYGGRVSRPVQRDTDGSGDPSYGRWTWWPLLPVAATIAAVPLYGALRLNQTPPGHAGPTANVALIQTSLDVVFEPDETGERAREIFHQVRTLTDEATARQPNLDLVVWPESMFPPPNCTFEEPFQPPEGSPMTADEWQAIVPELQRRFQAVLAHEAERINANTDRQASGTHLLLGTTTWHYSAGPPRNYNSAVLADREGNIVGRYDKMHAVMFGEYIPFGNALPWIYRLTPMDGGMSEGDGPTVFDVAGLKFSPSICFESTVPHLIRGHVTGLARRGTPADVLVNITNDGWFHGTAVLDLHFRCGVFRAVENRKPLIVAANTGFSAAIDGNGVIRERGPRRQTGHLIAAVQADGRASPYHTLGDLPAWLLAAGCIGLAGYGMWERRRVVGRQPMRVG